MQASRYQVTLDSLPADKRTAAFWTGCFNRFAAAPTFPLQKRNRRGVKTLDAKHCVRQLGLSTSHMLSLEIAVTPKGTLSPQEFLRALADLSEEETKILRVTKIQTVFHAPVEVEVDPTEAERTPASLTPPASARNG